MPDDKQAAPTYPVELKLIEEQGMYVQEKHRLYRIQYSLQFQTSPGCLQTYSLWIGVGGATLWRKLDIAFLRTSIVWNKQWMQLTQYFDANLLHVSYATAPGNYR